MSEDFDTISHPASWVAENPGPFLPQVRPPDLDEREQATVDRFHDLYYSKLDEGRGLHTVVLSWMGYEMFKCPTDLWTYQEMIFTLRPDVVVETGTYKGGSALFLACVCDMVGHGEIITVDIDATHRPMHPRITYLQGSSTGQAEFAAIRERIGDRRNILVILDSDHRRDHVLNELRLYSALIPPGGYIIVEDTNINGHPTYPTFGPGPWEAVDQFLSETDAFIPDPGRERFLLTMAPRGFLKRHV